MQCFLIHNAGSGMNIRDYPQKKEKEENKKMKRTDRKKVEGRKEGNCNWN